jgi:hypothetical protein
MPKLKLKFIHVHDTNKRLAKNIVERANRSGYNCEYIDKECSIESKGQRPGFYPNEMIKINRDTYFTEYKDEWEAWKAFPEKFITLELIPEQGENKLEEMYDIQRREILDQANNIAAYVFEIVKLK